MQAGEKNFLNFITNSNWSVGFGSIFTSKTVSIGPFEFSPTTENNQFTVGFNAKVVSISTTLGNGSNDVKVGANLPGVGGNIEWSQKSDNDYNIVKEVKEVVNEQINNFWESPIGQGIKVLNSPNAFAALTAGVRVEEDNTDNINADDESKGEYEGNLDTRTNEYQDYINPKTSSSSGSTESTTTTTTSSNYSSDGTFTNFYPIVLDLDGDVAPSEMASHEPLPIISGAALGGGEVVIHSLSLSRVASSSPTQTILRVA